MIVAVRARSAQTATGPGSSPDCGIFRHFPQHLLQPGSCVEPPGLVFNGSQNIYIILGSKTVLKKKALIQGGVFFDSAPPHPVQND